MRSDYKKWLEEQQYSPHTIANQLSETGRVEECYSDLEALHAAGKLQSVIDELTYSTADERNNKPNPSKIPVDGNIRNNLASYKNAVALYRKFLTGGWERSVADLATAESNFVEPIRGTMDFSEAATQKLSLERDMQAALRRDIKKLGHTLSIIDDGAERSVNSGFIDITCEDDADKAIVVIELKAGKSDSRAIGQILGYMGDLAQEEEGRAIKGMLVAHEFDKRTISAAHAVPTLSLVRYSVEFRFEPQD